MAAGNGAEGPFVLAVPSKGRLQEAAQAFFARAGLDQKLGLDAAPQHPAAVGIAAVGRLGGPVAELGLDLGLPIFLSTMPPVHTTASGYNFNGCVVCHMMLQCADAAHVVGVWRVAILCT